ncbi:MAG: c-type cytochrome [Bacteroidetes bacterium]|nr:c-type cytochrome [Bacteroidota bacterium]
MSFRLIILIQVTCLFAAYIISSCKRKDPQYPVNNQEAVSLTPYKIKYPAHFPDMVIPDDNKPYKERIDLGRMLYYDVNLSNDGRACATCHLQSYGFTVPGMVKEMPVLSHVNMGWYKNFMWDGSKTGGLEEVMQFETREFFATDLAKINNIAKYKTLFKNAFGVDNITYKEIGYALAQFARTMISGDSKYDRYMRGEQPLSPAEESGMNLFFTEKGDCFHCHTVMTTTDNSFHNTGLDSIYVKEMDKGYYNVTRNPEDLGKFKTPNLRNVALREHYMHDGRFTTLEQVINFYNSGVHKVGTLDPIMTKPGKEHGLRLTEEEKFQLVAFLKTLTDSTFLTNKEFSQPE